MDVTRRDLLKAGAVAAALTAVPRQLRAGIGAPPEPVAPPITDPDVKELALRAVDAARRAGAAYADVRLTHTRTRGFAPVLAEVDDSEQMVVGVRALVDGYWGFASGPVWTKDEMDRLGQEATHQAKTNTLGKSRVVHLAGTPVVHDGDWATPVAIDAFEMSPYEILDFLDSLGSFARRYMASHLPPAGGYSLSNGCKFRVQAKAFASSEGSFCTQRLYLAEGTFGVRYETRSASVDRALDSLSPAGVGWELYSQQPLRDQIAQLFDDVHRDLRTPTARALPGRFDVICNAASVAQLVSSTLAPATELDRALGYEANATGTSYITDPIGTVGTFETAAPLVTLTANRSDPGGAATVQWDDEGVPPDACVIIKDGVVVDFQTTRESASWLADRYRQQSVPVRSHGHAGAPSALGAPLQHTPNLRLVPANNGPDFEALIAGMDKGLAIEGVSVDMDAQVLSGYVLPRVYRISGGKRAARLLGGAILFRSPELWKGLTALGGAVGERRYGFRRQKGEPRQEMVHTVAAPPAAFKQLTLIDAGRKS